MHTVKMVALPAKLADSLDTYFQTSAFAQKNFTKFNREMVMATVVKAAARLGYAVTAGEGKSAGQFVFARATQTLRVTRANFPNAELRVA